jgi:hypothetical protein
MKQISELSIVNLKAAYDFVENVLRFIKGDKKKT